jgi:hypothetical protein
VIEAMSALLVGITAGDQLALVVQDPLVALPHEIVVCPKHGIASAAHTAQSSPKRGIPCDRLLAETGTDGLINGRIENLSNLWGK